MDREQLDSWCEKGVLYLILAILIYSPLAIGALRPQEFVVVQWLTVAMLVVWFVRFCVNPKHRLLWVPICWPVLAFVGYAIGRYLTADVEFLARQELIRLLIYAGIFFAVVNNLHRQETTQIVGLTLIFLAMAISLYAVYQFLADSDYVWHFYKPEGYRKRGSGTFICPNNLAGYLEIILPLALAFTLTGRLEHVMKICIAYAALASFAGITVTISRGGWLATGVTLIVMFFWLLRQRDYRKQSLLLLGVLIGIFVVFFWKADIPPNRYERFGVAFDLEDVRFRLWAPATKIWQDHFWFGAGPAHFDCVFRQYRPADPALQARPDRVHNDYLNTLTDWGLVGAILVLLCWLAFYWQVFAGWKYVQRSQNDLAAKRSNKSAFVLGGSLGLLAILVHSFVDFNMHVPANAILVVTILALVSAHFRFSSERYWHTVRLPLRIPVTATLLVALAYLGFQTWKRTAECHWLVKSDGLQANSDAKLATLKKAFAAEDKNFETAYQIGEILRARSFQGLKGYKELARQAMEWFKRTMELNALDPRGFIGYGMCLHWLGEHRDAATYFAQAQRLDPNGYSTQASLGWHYFQLEEYTVAKKWFEKSLTLVSDEARNPIPYRYLKIIIERLKDNSVPK